MESNYSIVAYLIGAERYKQLAFKSYNNRLEAVREYRTLLNQYYKIKEFVVVMLNDDYRILTAWALETPVQMIEACKIALNKFERGEDLFIDDKVKMENLFGSQVYLEIIDQAKSLKLIPEDYTLPVTAPLPATTSETTS